MGQPALTTWGANRLDVVFRRIDSTLGHAFTNSGSGTWTIENFPAGTPGGVIKNFPTAVTTTNTLWVYVTGKDNQLYRVTQVNGSTPTTLNVSSAAGMTSPVSGLPSLFRAASGAQATSIRMGTNLVEIFAGDAAPLDFREPWAARRPVHHRAVQNQPRLVHRRRRPERVVQARRSRGLDLPGGLRRQVEG